MTTRSILGLLLLGLSLPNLACAEEVPPIATAIIVDGFECHVENDLYLEVDACVGVGEEIFVVYSRFDTETLKREFGVVAGTIDDSGHAALRPTTVIKTDGGWHSHNYVLHIEHRGSEKVIFFTPHGQPDVFGEFTRTEQAVPREVLDMLPEDGEPGYYGTVPSSNEKFFVYSTPPAQDTEEEEDEISQMMEMLYPTVWDMHVLMGEEENMRPVEVTRTFSYGGGAHIYIETERGLFFFPSHRLPPIFGTIADRHYVPE